MSSDKTEAETIDLGVLRSHGEFHLVSLTAIPTGTLLFDIVGTETNTPSRHSVQVGPNTHLVVDADIDTEAHLDSFRWQFMNHHCQPNCALKGRSVVSVRNIAPYEEISFNYNTTEFEMSVPFECRCGSAECLGVIRGYKHLSDAERERIRVWTAEHLSGLDEPTVTSESGGS